MTTALSLIPTLLLIPLLALVLRVIAKLVARATLWWRHSFATVLLLFLVVITSTALSKGLGGVFEWLGPLIALLLQIAIGAFFLGPRCRSTDGLPGTYKTGLKVMGTLFVLGLVLGFILSVVTPAGADLP